MRKKLTALSTALTAMVLTASATATTITDIYGDKDGFGTGVQDGEFFWPWEVATESDDEGFTDRWVFGTQSWSHVYDISGLTNITSASLTVFSGGQGLGVFVASEVYIDGNYVGDLTDGEIRLANYAHEDVFDLTAYANLLDGSNTLEVRTYYQVDAWVLDYSEISITGTLGGQNPNNPNAPVPEPATMTLLGLGLAGLVMRKRGIRA